MYPSVRSALLIFLAPWLTYCVRTIRADACSCHATSRSAVAAPDAVPSSAHSGFGLATNAQHGWRRVLNCPF
jgi:hypothetical protein